MCRCELIDFSNQNACAVLRHPQVSSKRWGLQILKTDSQLTKTLGKKKKTCLCT